MLYSHKLDLSFWVNLARTKARLLSYPALQYPHAEPKRTRYEFGSKLTRAQALENYNYFIATKGQRADLIVSFTEKWDVPIRRDLDLEATVAMTTWWLVRYGAAIKPKQIYGRYTRQNSIVHDLSIVLGDRITELTTVPGWHFHEDDPTPRPPSSLEIAERRVEQAREAEWNPDVDVKDERWIFEPIVEDSTGHWKPCIGGGSYRIYSPLEELQQQVRVRSRASIRSAIAELYRDISRPTNAENSDQ